MRRQGSKPQGFSLIEAAVAIAIIAILASAAAPLVMKALNQQREQKTRDSLKIVFEAMFGARDRRVANMRADFGFTPPTVGTVAMADLRFLTSRNSPPAGNAPVAYPTAAGGGAFSVGWNGPYWSGSVQRQGAQNLPVDGWGRSMRLGYVGGGYRVESPGQDGQFGTADDLFYPNVAAPLSQFSCTPKLTVTNFNTTTSRTLNVRFVSSANLNGVQCVESGTTNQNVVLNANKDQKTLVLPAGVASLPPGPIQIVVSITAPASAITTSRILYDFQPGDQRTIEFGIN